MKTKKRPTKPYTPRTALPSFLDHQNDSMGIIGSKNGEPDGLVGVDPGGKGAFTIYYPKTNKYEIVPLERVGSNQMLLNISFCKYHVIENVASMPGQGVASSFKFGQEFGRVIATCEINAQNDYTKIGFVQPRTWQEYFELKYFFVLPKGKANQSERKRALQIIAQKEGINLSSTIKMFGISDKDAADSFLITRWALARAFNIK